MSNEIENPIENTIENTEAIAPESHPQSQPESDLEAPSFGWNAYAERLNGRFAMLAFVVLLLLEFVTRQDFWTWVGLR